MTFSRLNQTKTFILIPKMLYTRKNINGSNIKEEGRERKREREREREGGGDGEAERERERERESEVGNKREKARER